MRKILNGSFRSLVMSWDSVQLAVEKFVKEGFQFDVPPGLPTVKFDPVYAMSWFQNDAQAPVDLLVEYRGPSFLTCRKCGGFITSLRWLLCPVFSETGLRPFAFKPRQLGVLVPYCDECDEPPWIAGPGVWEPEDEGSIKVPTMFVTEEGEITWDRG